MYQSFSKYKQIRENHDLEQKVNLLCESIVKSGKSFDDWWLEHGLPTVIQNSYSNENELLIEFMGEMGQGLARAGQNAWQGVKNFGRGVQAGWEGGPTIPAWQPSGGMNPNNPVPAAQQPPAPNAAAQQPPAPNTPAAAQQPPAYMPPGNKELLNQVQSTQQSFIQKLKEFQRTAIQSKDQSSYKAIDHLIKAMSSAARPSFSMGQGQGQAPQAPQGPTSGSGLSSSGGNVGSQTQQALVNR